MRSYEKEIAPFAEYGLGCGKAMQIADYIVDLKKVIEGKKVWYARFRAIVCQVCEYRHQQPS